MIIFKHIEIAENWKKKEKYRYIMAKKCKRAVTETFV